MFRKLHIQKLISLDSFLLDKTAAKFRQTLGRVNWDLKLTQWLHNTLLQYMNTSYLAAYLDILQVSYINYHYF